MKVFIILCSVALAKAGVIHDFAPNVYSIHTPAIKTVTNTYTPITYSKYHGPVYDSVLSTHQSTTKSLDGTTRQDTLIKSLDTPYASVKKYDSRTTTGTVLHSVPTYSVATPVVHSPVYTTHSVAAPSVALSTPIVTKTLTPGLSTYASHTPVLAAHPVKVHYSEAPLVSHMSFTGLGTSYSW